MMNSYILMGKLMHSRRTPVRNAFTYPVFTLVLDLDDLPTLNRGLLFGYNRLRLVSLYSQDHLGDPQKDIKTNLLAYLAQQGVQLEGGKIWLLTNPRILGYVFNPVSFYYCYDARGEWVCTVAEVNNTFGEYRPYLLDARCALPNAQADDVKRYWANKVFYVSPFIEMDARYEFAFSPLLRDEAPSDTSRRASQQTLFAHIDEFRAGEKFFQARLWGDLQPLTTRALWSVLWRYPLMTIQVIALIHWQALKLWRLGARWISKDSVTYEAVRRA